MESNKEKEVVEDLQWDQKQLKAEIVIISQ